MNLQMLLIRLNPALPKKWLLVLSGVMWTGVGIMLLRYALSWLTQSASLLNLLLGLLGLMIAVAAYRFEFSKLAGKNIGRILSLPERACLFAFQNWRGYLIIAVMITGGILLRSSALPKPYLAVAYAAIGGALLLASFGYYQRFFSLPG